MVPGSARQRHINPPLRSLPRTGDMRPKLPVLCEISRYMEHITRSDYR